MAVADYPFPMAIDLNSPEPGFIAFWQEYHLSTLTTQRPDGSLHVVPVGVTLDAKAGVARIITRSTSTKVANITGARPGTARVAVCQVSGGRWATLEGFAVVRTEPDLVADAVARYGERYGRTPAPDPERVLIEITLDRAMGQTAAA
jgi:PPOX class probable F420-dependent enzyme